MNILIFQVAGSGWMSLAEVNILWRALGEDGERLMISMILKSTHYLQSSANVRCFYTIIPIRILVHMPFFTRNLYQKLRTPTT